MLKVDLKFSNQNNVSASYLVIDHFCVYSMTDLHQTMPFNFYYLHNAKYLQSSLHILTLTTFLDDFVAKKHICTGKVMCDGMSDSFTCLASIL